MSIESPFVPNTAAMIGNDILDIGSRRARRQHDDAAAGASNALMVGAPGQFDIPNVSNVSSISRDLTWID